MEIILIRGLPGSGKSTMARDMVSGRNIEHVEADDFFVGADGHYRYDPSKIGDAHERCYADASAALNVGKSVVIANTFSRKWEMEAYYRLAGSFGCDVRVLVAKGDYGNIHGVPQEVIERMRKRWEE